MKIAILYLVIWLMNLGINSPCQALLERTYKQDEKRKNAKYQETMIHPTWNLDFFKNLIVKLDSRPLCIISCEILFNDAMKPLTLERHLQSKHPKLAKKPLYYFKRIREDMQQQVGALKTMVVEDKSLLKASAWYHFEFRKIKKPHTTGEVLIKPCMLQACEVVLGNQSLKKLKRIPLSANTVNCRIEEMSDDIENKVIKW